MKTLITTILVLFFSFYAHASGFILHGVELGVGKFHRMDNKAHPYGEKSAWTPYVLPDGKNSVEKNSTDGFIQSNYDGSVSVFFTSLEELFQLSAKAAKIKGQEIEIFNVHGHGLPGAMWYPKDQKERDGFLCGQWRANAYGSDAANFNTYYTTISKSEILSIRRMSERKEPTGMNCVTGAKDWELILTRNQEFKAVLSDSVQVNFLSCVVGLGVAGENFAAAIAKTLLKTSKGKVLSSINFGLGDWSMPEGMGFWDFVSDEQLAYFNQHYPVDQKDRDIMLKGMVRETVLNFAQSENKIFSDISFLELNKSFSSGFMPLPFTMALMTSEGERAEPELGFVRIPHTNEIVLLK